MTSQDIATSSLNVRSRPCPVCGDDNESTPPGPYGREPWHIIDCVTCGFTYMRDVPVASELEETLAWEKTYPAEKARRKRDNPILSWIDEKTRWRLHLFPRTEGTMILNRQALSGPVLDLGCGSGFHLRNLDSRLTPYGVEISKALAQQAAAHVEARGGKVVQAPSADGIDQFPDGFFTGALLRSYLEHDADARDVLSKLRRKMRPGGMVVVKVPNYGSVNRMIMGARWCGFRLPDHVNYFSKKSLRRLAESLGYEIRFPPLLSLPTDDNMYAILRA